MIETSKYKFRKSQTSDNIADVINTDLPLNWDKVEEELTAHKAENATDLALGHVKVDGVTIFVDEYGVLSLIDPNDVEYLYDNGAEFTTLTGEWNDGYTFSGMTKIASVKEADHVRMTLNTTANRFSAIGTNIKVDLTNYSKVFLLVDIISKPQFARLNAFNTKEIYDAQAAATMFSNYNTVTPTIGDNTVEMDVSSLTGEYYIAVFIQQGSNASSAVWGGGDVKVKKIWME